MDVVWCGERARTWQRVLANVLHPAGSVSPRLWEGTALGCSPVNVPRHCRRLRRQGRTWPCPPSAPSAHPPAAPAAPAGCPRPAHTPQQPPARWLGCREAGSRTGWQAACSEAGMRWRGREGQLDEQWEMEPARRLERARPRTCGHNAGVASHGAAMRSRLCGTGGQEPRATELVSLCCKAANQLPLPTLGSVTWPLASRPPGLQVVPLLLQRLHLLLRQPQAARGARKLLQAGRSRARGGGAALLAWCRGHASGGHANR